MVDFKKKKKLSSSGKTTREKMLERKKQLENRSKGGGLIFPKEGTLRVRIKSPGEDKELGIEVIQFYLGEMGGIISPATFDEPCPFMEKYQELKESDDEDDKELAKRLIPRKRYIIGVIGYKDDKGKEIDPEMVNKGCLIPTSVYQDIVDLYLDEDEWGDMTDDIEGYDIKITRSGKGKTDTKYTTSPCQKKPLDKKYRGTIDLEKVVKSIIPSYEDLEEKLKKFLNESTEDEDDEDERPKKKKLLNDKDKKKKKKSHSGDI